MYNKQQRKEIYLKALKAFTEKTEVAFMCHELSKAKNPEGAPFTPHDELLKQFPEWANCRPIGFSYRDSNVWEDEEIKGSLVDDKKFNELRETILCLCIAQL